MTKACIDLLACEDGREEGKIEIVLEMLRFSQSLAFISKMTKFSTDKMAEIGRMNDLAITK